MFSSNLSSVSLNKYDQSDLRFSISIDIIIIILKIQFD